MNKVVLSIISLMIFGFVSANELENKDDLSVSTFYDESALAKESKTDTVYIQTSAVCNMCKERLEHDMAFEKGVKAIELDMETKKLMIVYRRDKNTVEGLKKAITEIGYDADDMVADQKAHDRLPACCQKDAEPH
ncbi:MAG: hypothetical protein P8100_05585 [bacterium]